MNIIGGHQLKYPVLNQTLFLGILTPPLYLGSEIPPNNGYGNNVSTGKDKGRYFDDIRVLPIDTGITYVS